ncbi:MAG: UDP-glucose 4-epimerase GalE [Candidatus Dojkabacteria bacterium]|uniref:UDP-glucose 4-epimerase n=2 Tax=Candidatus Dojkabacteria TaxID=74243 RepID=A0A136KG29_9BACT|nr:MAG: UDP-glucose 4-epimerase [candidate division WS6 bacterium OLB21]MBW7953797.1 UDP-glucose 4-epimerase GalE [Candidatus Dojkabacteria bacterium]WKZ27646.1 MAG: UDP-glucose 4-epimerase GalE [Candidatus Dojkabacteria bacterium]
MNILITGGAGYIGSHTALTLIKAGHKVTILDHLQKHKEDILETLRSEAGDFELLKLELQNQQELQHALENRTFDAVIHFAASIEVGISTEKPVAFVNNNVVGSQFLFDALIANGNKNFIFSSSAAVYGTPESVPIKETDKISLENPYAMTKYVTEEILRSYANFADVNVVALRYFNPAGSYNGLIGERHNPETHLIPRLLHGLTTDDFVMKVFGNDYDTPDGTAVRDYIHIVDLAEAHATCIDYVMANKGFEVFNIGTGKGTSILEVIQSAEAITGKKINYEVAPRRIGDSASLIADPSKIEKMIGWKAKYDLEDIISSAWEWEQKRPKTDYA